MDKEKNNRNSQYSRRYKIACMGDNCVDYYDETREAFFGGNPVNVAVYLQRFGVQSSYLGAVGNDSFGDEMKEAIASHGVDISHLRTEEGTTALTHVTVQEGERILGDYDEGVMADYALREEDYAFIAEHDLAVTGLWGHCENALERIRALGVATAFDCADRPEDPAAQTAVPHTDILFFSDDASTDDALRAKLLQMHRDGAKIVVATRGEKGSISYDGKEFVSFGIIPCEVADTMGAGDSYIAGFLAAWLQEKSIAECMEAGARCSAVTLSYSGAWQRK